MTTRRQAMLSIAMVLAATAIVAGYALRDVDAAPATEQSGHDHAAMTASGAATAKPVHLSEDAGRRIGVTYVTAERKPLRRAVRAVGAVTFDETRVSDVTLKVDGWVERLHVDYTGAPVRRGQALLALYSPALVTAQEELLLANGLARDALARGDSGAAGRAAELADAARRRLRFWDVPAAEIARVERTGEPARTLTFAAPTDGVVVEKQVVEGSRVVAGSPLLRVADLSRVWLEGEVFEQDLSLVRVGQRATVRMDAYPGERFDGRIAFVHPTLALESRTARVRVELANPGFRLMPGMYASLELSPETDRSALMIPRDAVHHTGERALVFVPDASGALAPREIVTGLTAGGDVEVLAGLVEGERVVASANFLIDAESSMGRSAVGGAGDEASEADVDHTGHGGS